MRMEPITDEERYHYEVGRPCRPPAICDARFLLHEGCMHFRILASRTDQLNLPLNCFPRILIITCPMARNKECRLCRQGRPRGGLLRHNCPGPGQKRFRHAGVRPDRPAIVQRLPSAPLDAWEIHLPIPTQTQFARNDLLSEIPLADKERHNEHPRCKRTTQHPAHRRLLFPETH